MTPEETTEHLKLQVENAVLRQQHVAYREREAQYVEKLRVMRDHDRMLRTSILQLLALLRPLQHPWEFAVKEQAEARVKDTSTMDPRL